MSLNIIGGPVSPIIDYFEVIKAPPSSIIEVDIFDDENYRINNLYKKLFQFKYRFVYDDNEKSVWSAISKIPIPAKSTDTFYNALSNKQNAISLKLFTGDINVSKIEIAGRVNIENEWSDFFLVDTIDKKRDKILDNFIYTYVFRNDSVYTPIDIQESNLLFDYVPDEANALELANGNTLVVGGLKDGYSRDTELDVVITNLSNVNSPAVLSTLSATPRNPSDTAPFQYIDLNQDYSFGIYNPNDGFYYPEFNIAGIIKFDGVPQVGDVITITLNGYSEERWTEVILGVLKTNYRKLDISGSWSVTFRSGWGILDLINEFYNHPSLVQGSWGFQGSGAYPSKPFFSPIGYGSPITTPINNALYFGALAVNTPDRRRWVFTGASVSIKRSFSFGQSDVFPTYKWNGLYKFGLVYYDKHGKTNGVYTNPSMSIRTGNYNTDYIWTNSNAQIVIPENETAQIYIGHEPPPWASYYHIVRTKELSCDFSLMVLSCDVRIPGDGYVYLDIENLEETNKKSQETSKVINYSSTSFVDGDRLRIMRKYNSSTRAVVWDTKDFLDVPILAVADNGTRREIKIKQIDTSSNNNIITFVDNDVLVLEIYRPAKVLSDEDLVYYEIGEKYDVVSDINGTRYHNGQQIVSGVPISTYIVTTSCNFDNTFGNKVVIFPALPSDVSWFSKIKQGDLLSISGTNLNNNTFTVSGISIDLNITIFFSTPIVSNEFSSVNTIFSLIGQPGKKYAYINLFNDGDYYFKIRTMICDTGTSNFGPFFVADKNFSETYLSAVWSQGRPLIVDENIKEEYYPAMLRFSQSYIYGTNINNLNRFYPNNFEEADASFGDILRLKTRENFIRLFQRFKTGMIPIYRQIIIDNAQSSQVALSERLLNKPNYYSGEYGIDKYGSSLVSTDFGDYFIDTNNKAIVRASLDGITNISDTYNLAAWANANISEDSYGYGCFNYENRNVIMLIGTFKEVPGFPGVFLPQVNIVAYSESDKKFESFYGFVAAQNMQFVNGFIFSGAGGQWYIHDNPVRNNFFGDQQSSAITTVFNGGLQLKKTYTAIEELSNGLWTGTITTGPLTNQLSSLVAGDFAKTIGAYTINSKENKFNATIKRDQNSAGGKFQGDTMKGLYAQVALTNSLTTEQRLISVSLKYIPSPLTNS